MSTAAIPDGFTEVTKSEFFDFLRRDPRDIMPRTTERHYSTWETPNRFVAGWTAPGWANSGAHADVYALNDSVFTHHT